MKRKNIIFMVIVFLVSVGLDLSLSGFGGWKYFGTFISAFFGGPLVSVPVGIVSTIVDTGVGNIGRWILLIGHLLIALVAGVMVAKGFAKKFWKPFIIFIIALVIATLASYLRFTMWLLESVGIKIWDLGALKHFFLLSPQKYIMDVIKLGWSYAIPMFISVYIAWLIPKIATMKYDFKY
ncbi:MAG: hypothetical protein J7K01_06645, partial [Thermovirga sp.]|nr:hypothetical protein [Thermovirga sp.]